MPRLQTLFSRKPSSSSKRRSARRRKQLQVETLEKRLVFAALLGQADFDYLGAFRVPSGNYGSSTFAYGGTAPAYNASNESLFLVGHDHHQQVAEISIPELVDSTNINSLNTASVLQPFQSVQSQIPDWTLDSQSKVGGLQVVDDRLVGTFYEYYDGNYSGIDSHFQLSTTDLSSATVDGLHQVGTYGGGFVGGYMAEVPAQWQDELGAPYLTGQAALSIIGRTSSGPAAFGFDPNDLGDATAEAIDYVNYPLSNPLRPETSTNPLYNLTTEITGVVFPPDSNSVIFFGSHGTGDYCYGEPSDCNDPVREGKGTHSRGGQYEYQAWAYDVEDFIAVKNGESQPWEVQPYDVWTFDLPFPQANKHIGGVSFDSSTGRVFISQMLADYQGYDPYPIINVFQLPVGDGGTQDPPADDPPIDDPPSDDPPAPDGDPGTVDLGAGPFTYSNPDPLAAPDPATTVRVTNVTELVAAVNNLQTGQTISIAPGDYQLAGTVDALYVPQGISDWMIRGETGNRDDVTIRGNGMTGSVRFGFWIGDSPSGTIADLTIDGMREHGVIANFGAHDMLFHGLRVVDIGDQFIKSNPAGVGNGNDRGIVQYSVFEYRSIANDTYTNGVDVHGGSDWQVHHNLFRNFLAPSGQGVAGPAILIWNGSTNTSIDANTFINNSRGISLGLFDRENAFDHEGGTITNNMFYRDAGLNSAIDVPIYVADSPATQIDHNTVLDQGNYPNAIEYRFGSSSNTLIRNNLTNGAIQSRDGGTATRSGNLTNATASLFVDAAAGDLHLVDSATLAIDQGDLITSGSLDFDGQSRLDPVDVGADEVTDNSGPDPDPVNQPPSIGDQSAAIAENSSNQTFVTSVVANDPDGDAFGYSILDGNELDAFAIDDNGAIRVNNSAALDFESRTTFGLLVEVSDEEGLTATATVTIAIEDVDENVAPTATGSAFSVLQTAAVGTVIGDAIASDPDSSSLSFELISGNPGDTFAMDPSTGSLRIRNATSLNQGLFQQANLAFRVTDDGGLSDTATIQIDVIPVVDDPDVPLPDPLFDFQLDEGRGSRTFGESGAQAILRRPRWTTGKDGTALQFDGIDDRLFVRRSYKYGVSEAMTVAAWVKPDSLGDWQTAILKERAGGLAYGLYVSDDQSRPAIYVNLGYGDQHVTADAPLPVGSWSHLAATFDGDYLKLYVNGELAGEEYLPGSIVASSRYIQFGGNSVWGEYYDGAMDDIQLYDVALSESQVTGMLNLPTAQAVPAIAYAKGDVNFDGRLSALDALTIINRLPTNGEGEMVNHDLALLDLNGDNRVTALDALLVINHLNNQEPESPIQPDFEDDDDETMIAMLADDTLRSIF